MTYLPPFLTASLYENNIPHIAMIMVTALKINWRTVFKLSNAQVPMFNKSNLILSSIWGAVLLHNAHRDDNGEIFGSSEV